jgi:hypothetical protein
MRSGEYSAASAYETQFLGVYSAFRASTIWQARTKPNCHFFAFRASTIWQARTKPNCHFFAWVAIMAKVPITYNHLKKNWPCDLNCPLWYCMPKTNDLKVHGGSLGQIGSRPASSTGANPFSKRQRQELDFGDQPS